MWREKKTNQRKYEQTNRKTEIEKKDEGKKTTVRHRKMVPRKHREGEKRRQRESKILHSRFHHTNKIKKYTHSETRKKNQMEKCEMQKSCPKYTYRYEEMNTHSNYKRFITFFNENKKKNKKFPLHCYF